MDLSLFFSLVTFLWSKKVGRARSHPSPKMIKYFHLTPLTQYYSKAVSPYRHSYLVQTVRCWLDGSSTDRSFLLAMPKRPHTNRVESICVERVLLRARCAFTATQKTHARHLLQIIQKFKIYIFFTDLP